MTVVDLVLSALGVWGAGSLAVKVWDALGPPRLGDESPEPPEPFEPGDCSELPAHPWGWEDRAFQCPVCSARQPSTATPPYCAERGGHFHFKCAECGYEWVMGTYLAYEAQREAAVRAEREARANAAALNRAERKAAAAADHARFDEAMRTLRAATNAKTSEDP